MMRPLKLGIALTLAAGAALAQQRTEPLPTFSERVEVQVLDLDVDVTDAKGNPVPDLKKEEFTIKIGGKVAPIDYFARVDQGAIHAPDVAAAPPDDVLAIYRKGGEDAYVPRNFLIYIDVGYLPPGRRNASLNALRDLVTSLGPNDAARVVLFDRSPKVLADWTTSKETIMDALSLVEKQSPGGSRLQSQIQTMALIDSSGSNRRAASSRMQLARQYGQEVGSEIETMLASMKDEILTLTPLNGKRAFLFLSGGFEFQPGYVMAQYAAGGLPNLSNINVRDTAQDVTSLIQKANANDIIFYTVDATGLTTDGFGAEAAPGNFQQGLENRPSILFQARQDRQTGLSMLAYDTGGVALLNSNDFKKGLSRIYQDVSTYYTLGVPLSKLGIGPGYQDVKVTVSRPGVTVRARRGFEQLPESTLVANRALATMETNLTYTAIPIRVETAPAVAGKKLYELPVTLAMPASALTFVPEGDKATARVEFYIGSMDDKGRTSDLTRQEATFTIPADKASSDALVRYEARLQTKKGNYRITINARDASSGKMGTARANVRVE